MCNQQACVHVVNYFNIPMDLVFNITAIGGRIAPNDTSYVDSLSHVTDDVITCLSV